MLPLGLEFASGPGAERLIAAAAVLFGYLGFTFVIIRGHRRRAVRARTAARDSLVTDATAKPLILIAYASQTGAAEGLARRTADSLAAGPFTAVVADLKHVDAAVIASVDRALFVVSTTGEGDAPDSAMLFERGVMSSPAALAKLRYGVLALGDRKYQEYCAFGHRLDTWLRHSGATSLFDLVEVDDGDAGALRQWQHHLRELAGQAELADWEAPPYGRWRLAERRLLNDGSPGGPAFHLTLEPEGASASWQAGDIAEVGPEHDPADVEAWLAAAGIDPGASIRLDGETVTLAFALATRALHEASPEQARLARTGAQELVEQLPRLSHREYSIASIAATGRIELLVRQMRGADGRLGLGSGWLTRHATVGGPIALRVRANRAFHGPAVDVPMILIGNGTGLAGLRAHIAARAAAGGRRAWLLFGERTASHDRFFRDDLDRWQEEGVLSRVDLAFSREGGGPRYVQDLLLAAPEELRRWVAAGAAIYVCGSFQGMAAGVDAALTAILGQDAVEALSAAGRYRRDVY